MRTFSYIKREVLALNCQAMTLLCHDRPTSTSQDHGSVTHQASPLRVNTEITKESANYVDLDVTKEVEDSDIDADTCCTKRSRSSAISCNNPASDGDVFDSELEDDQNDSAQSPQSGPAVASLQQSDLTNDPLPRHRRRRDATRNFGCKRPRPPAPTGLASYGSV